VFSIEDCTGKGHQELKEQRHCNTSL